MFSSFSVLCATFVIVACESDCPPGYTTFNHEACFKVVYSKRFVIFQENAARACKDSLGTLATLESPVQEKWIVENFLNETGHTYRVWIGYVRNKDDPHQFDWMDNSTSEYANWRYREPNNIHETCVNMQAYGGGESSSWNDLRCTEKEVHGFICRAEDPRRTTTTSIVTTTDVVDDKLKDVEAGYRDGCPFGYVAFNEVCFKVHTIYYSISNSEAASKCIESSGVLASFDNADQEIWIANNYLSDRHTRYRLWMGLNRLKSNRQKWYWIDGSKSSYRNWAPREPNDEGDGRPEDCTELEVQDYSRRIGWNDIPCTSTYVRGYICRAPYKAPKVTESPPLVQPSSMNFTNETDAEPRKILETTVKNFTIDEELIRPFDDPDDVE